LDIGDLTEKEQRRNVNAMAILRQYLTDDVLQVLIVGDMSRASSMYNSLKKMFLFQDARTNLQVQRELHACEMKMGESVMVFLGGINRLINELTMMGEHMPEQVRLTVVARLRRGFREAVNDRSDADI
jgi:urease accessory protein UreF